MFHIYTPKGARAILGIHNFPWPYPPSAGLQLTLSLATPLQINRNANLLICNKLYIYTTPINWNVPISLLPIASKNSLKEKRQNVKNKVDMCNCLSYQYVQ